MLNRRELLQVGASSYFGVSLSGLMQRKAQAAQTPARTKSVVLVFLTGGGSHIDMFDPKPDSPEVKGEFDPIDTQIPGVEFGELMSGMAQRANRLAIVRSMSHGDNRHLSGTHNTLSGHVQPFRGDSNQDKSLNREDWPCYGGALEFLRPTQKFGMPSQVNLPNFLNEGALVWPAQHAGFLGPKFDPMQLKNDPNGPNFKVNDLSLIDGLSMGRLEGRWQLLNDVGLGRQLGDTQAGRRLNTQQEAAYSMLTSGRLKKAFRIQDETAETRERYGRNKLGQTLLLARRLVEAEIPVIQCNMGIVQSWDTHVDHFPRLKTKLLPPTDQGVSALIDDLVDRGLFDETLIIVVGEFGRTPKISPLANQKVPGRHHWAHGYTAVFAGGGVRGGQVIGRTDRIGGHPTTDPWHPNDLGATVYDSLGVDPRSNLHDRSGRPIPLNKGKVMHELYS